MTAAFPASLDYPHTAPPEPGVAVEVAPRVFWLRMPLPFALDPINLWLLEDGDAWARIDCGVGTGATRSPWRFFAMSEAIAHLNCLWRAGRLVRDIAAAGSIRFALAAA